MTDLERARLAYRTIDAFGWDISWKTANPIPDDAWPIDIIANALAAARREGAEEMRERALEAARDGVRVAFGERRDEEFIDENDVIGSIEDAFASTLPLTPEEPP